MYSSVRTYRWTQGFPAVFWHTSIPFLKKCPGFYMARCGDLPTARAVVNRCIKPQRIDELRFKYADAVLLPVTTRNKLPLALAQAIGLEICTCAATRRTGEDTPGRSMRHLAFEPIAPRRYILVNDIIDQSVGLGALRKHVTACGGTVEAVAALACSFGEEIQMPKSRHAWLLESRHGSAQISMLLQEFHTSELPLELTHCQIA